MSTIVECLSADSVAVSADMTQRITQLNSMGLSIDGSPLTYTTTMMDGGSAAMTAGYTDHYVSLLGVSISAAVSVLPIVQAKDLALAFVQAQATALSIAKQLAAVSVAVAATTFANPITSMLAAGPAAMTVQPLPLNHYVALVNVGIQIVAAIDLRMFELAKATSVAMTAAAIQAAHPKNLAAASSVAVSATALQVQHAKQLLAASIAVAATKIDVLNATDLNEADLVVYASALDGQGDVSQAWTAPTDTMAMSRYTLPDGLAGIAAGLAGVLVIDAVGVGARGGLTDYGAEIDEVVRTGLMDFRNESIKNLGDLYLAFSSTKGIAIDVGETSTGVEITYSYNSPQIAATALMPMRVQEGRGIESRHRRYTIRNVDGDKLSLRGFRAVLNDMSRRF